jgi:hypothetical protein
VLYIGDDFSFIGVPFVARICIPQNEKVQTEVFPPFSANEYEFLINELFIYFAMSKVR